VRRGVEPILISAETDVRRCQMRTRAAGPSGEWVLPPRAGDQVANGRTARLRRAGWHWLGVPLPTKLEAGGRAMTKHALVVTADFDTAATWMAWLRAEGFVTTGCAGPDLTFGCPARRGAACPCRDVADVAVVDLESDIHRRCRTEGAEDAIVFRPRRLPSVAERADFRIRLEAAVRPQATRRA
jgi:hypothetical protein